MQLRWYFIVTWSLGWTGLLNLDMTIGEHIIFFSYITETPQLENQEQSWVERPRDAVNYLLNSAPFFGHMF